METNPQPERRQYDDPLEQLIAEIVADPDTRAEMLKPQPIDLVQNNPQTT